MTIETDIRGLRATRVAIALIAALVLIGTPSIGLAQSDSESDAEQSESEEGSSKGFFEQMGEDFGEFSNKLGGAAENALEDIEAQGDTDEYQADDGEADSESADESSQPDSPETFEAKLKDALDQSDEIRRNMRQIKNEMGRIFHQVRVSQKAIGAQYVQLGRQMATVHQTYEKISRTSGDNGALLKQLADSSMRSQEAVEQVTTFAMRYKDQPDLKGMILQAHRNTLKISALKGAVEKLRGEYEKMFTGVSEHINEIDSESIRGQTNRQEKLLQRISAAGNQMTTPLIRQTRKSEAVLRDVAEQYRSLSDEMIKTVEKFNETGSRYAIEAGKQIAIMTGLIAYIAEGPDSAAGILTKIGAGVATVQKLKEFVTEFQEFRQFYGWFKENKEALKRINAQTREQSTAVRERVSDMVVQVRGYRENIVEKLDAIAAGQEKTLAQAAEEFKQAAKTAEEKADEDAENERENMASSMSSGFPSAESTQKTS